MQLKKLNQNSKIIWKLLLVLLIVSCSASKVSNYDIAMRHYEEGRYRTSIDYFTQALIKDPANAELYYFRANAKARLEDNQEAVYDYTKAIKLKSKMKYYIERGLTYLRDIL
jgi:tetratricopeptide (TPR) repeat protein